MRVRPAPAVGTEPRNRLDGVEDDVSPDLARLLARLILPANRVALSAPVMAARLAEHIGIDRSGTSRYADRLEAAGLIKRTTDPLDRRATLLSLTPKGARVIDKLNAVLTAHLRSLAEGWPDGAARALAEGLRLLLDGPVTPVARLGTALGP